MPCRQQIDKLEQEHRAARHAAQFASLLLETGPPLMVQSCSYYTNDHTSPAARLHRCTRGCACCCAQRIGTPTNTPNRDYRTRTNANHSQNPDHHHSALPQIPREFATTAWHHSGILEQKTKFHIPRTSDKTHPSTNHRTTCAPTVSNHRFPIFNFPRSPHTFCTQCSNHRPKKPSPFPPPPSPLLTTYALLLKPCVSPAAPMKAKITSSPPGTPP